MSLPYLQSGCVAVITGSASGIGLATAILFAQRTMRVVLVDTDTAQLKQAHEAVVDAATGGKDFVMSLVADVSDEAEVDELCSAIYKRFGQVDVLMNNAAVRVAGGTRQDIADWRHTLEVNFWAAVYAERAFLTRMANQGTACAIINTGSKQGITNPPGENLIYNVSKSALKTYTEGLQHKLRSTRGCQVSAHLLVPGWTTTGRREHQEGAWKPEQVAEFLVKSLERGDFYILCPDDEIDRKMDERRILWAAGDIVKNRPALSRWHPDWKDKFM